MCFRFNHFRATLAVALKWFCIVILIDKCGLFCYARRAEMQVAFAPGHGAALEYMYPQAGMGTLRPRGKR